jgi:hypothetical protein
MTDEQRDPAAELRAQAEALAEGFRPLFEFANAAIEAFARAAETWLEQQRPFFEALGRLAQDPQVLAYAEERGRGLVLAQADVYRSCHCLCAKTHPAEKGICETFRPVTTRHYETELLGPVDVPLCAPCAAAQFIAEVT